MLELIAHFGSQGSTLEFVGSKKGFVVHCDGIIRHLEAVVWFLLRGTLQEDVSSSDCHYQSRLGLQGDGDRRATPGTRGFLAWHFAVFDFRLVCMCVCVCAHVLKNAESAVLS